MAAMRCTVLGVLLSGVVACGDSSGTSADAAGVVDAAAFDGSPGVDAAFDARGGHPERVTVRYRKGDQPVSDVDVVFSHPDGTVLSHHKTNAAGEAVEVMATGGMATVVIVDDPGDGGEPGMLALTYTGVQPGDVLQYVGDDSGATIADQDVQISMPAAFDGASAYRASIGCAQVSALPGGMVSLAHSASCVGSDGHVDAQVLALSGNQIVAHAIAKGIDTAVQPATVDLSGAVWDTTVDNVALRIDNVPAGIDHYRVQLFQGRDVNRFVMFSRQATAPTEESIAMPAGFADTHVIDLVMTRGASAMALFQRLAPSATVEVSLTTDVLPALTGVSVDSATAERPVVTWTSTDELTAADAVIATLTWSESSSGEREWRIVGDAGETALVMPALPETLAGLAPTSQASCHHSSVVAFASSLIGNFEQLRAVFALGVTEQAYTSALPTGSVGRVQYSSFEN